MTVLFAALQGAGCSAAIGVRPFLPALLVGSLASADAGVDFDGTHFAFLESTWFLLVLVVLIIVTWLRRSLFEAGPGLAAMQGLGLGLGAVEFAGTLDDVSGTWWPGIIGGIVLAALGYAAAQDLMTRVRARLDPEAAGTLFLYAEVFAIVVAGLSVAFPPLAVVGIGLLLLLLFGGRRREGQKYAGLRILR
jgi:hypothetical protein